MTHIQGFSSWIAQRFTSDGEWRHTYVSRNSGKRWTFTSLADAFHQYEWNAKPWSENFDQLPTNRLQLRKAIDDGKSDVLWVPGKSRTE